MAGDFDEVLQLVGHFGRYQKLMIGLACLACLSGCMQNFSTVFNMAVPDFRCAVPGLDNDTYEIQSGLHEAMVNASVPRDRSGAYTQCTLYTSVLEAGRPEVNLLQRKNDTEKCSRWVYSKQIHQLTVVSQLDLVCDQEEFRSHASMMLLMGLMCASICCSPFADIFGRKKVVVGTVFIQTVLGFCFPFINSVPLLMVFRFLIGASVQTLFMTVFVLVGELVGPRHRAFVGVLTMYNWSFGMFGLCIIFYFIRDWRYAQFVLTAPGVIYGVLFMWLLPESPRWLMSKGRKQEAGDVLRKMADVNRKTMPEKMFDIWANAQEARKRTITSSGRKQRLWDIFSTPTLAIRFIIICYNWMAVNLCYYGLTLNVGSLIEGDLYLNFALMSLSELIAYFVCQMLIDKIGRKPLYCATILIGGVACLATLGPILVFGDDHKWINVVLSNIGKFGCTAAFSTVYLFTTELLPTYARNSGLGMCSFVGRIAGVISPYIASAGNDLGGPVGKALPLVVLGSSTILAGLLALIIPETRNTTLPETIDEIGKTQSDPTNERTDLEDGDMSDVLPLKPHNTTVNS